MKNLRLSVKFALSFGLVVALCLLQGWLAYRSAADVDEDVTEVAENRIPSLEGLMLNRICTETADVMREAEQAVADLSDQAQSLRRLIMDIQIEAEGTANPAMALSGGTAAGLVALR